MSGSFVDLFPTRIGIFDFQDTEAKIAIQKTSGKVKTTTGRNISNFGGFQSSDLDFELMPKSFWSFFSKSVLSLACHMLKEDTELKVNVQNYWLNSNPKNASNAEHTHPLCDYSAVYYVYAPNMSGDICFHDPAAGLRDRGLLHNLCLTNQDWLKNPDMHATRLHFKPKAGQLIVFPAHITHSVSQNLCDEDRVSFAFNATVFK